MFTVKNNIVSGSDLPRKGRILLTNSLAFTIREYAHISLLFNSSNNENPSSLGIVSDSVLHTSLELLLRDHYIPLTGWIEMVDTDLYLTWDNSKEEVYSPKFPVQFETDTINTDYSTFYKMAQDGDPSLSHSKAPFRHSSQGDKEPLLSIKVTRLESDSQVIAINIIFSHMVMDACSATNFSLNWASLCRQMMADPELQLSPDCSNYKIPHPPLFGTPDLSKFRDLENKNYIENSGYIADNDNTAPMFSLPGQVDEYCLTLSESKQKELRNRAHESGVSFNIYLFAILWKEEMELQTRHTPEIIDNVSSFGIAIDTRSRLGISENFCSSAILSHFIKIKVRDILEMDTIDLAKTIKKKINSATTPEGICGYTDKAISVWKDICQYDGDVFINFLIESMKCVASIPMIVATSWLNFKLSDVDFGSGGPVNIRLSRQSIGGFIYITPANTNLDEKDIIVTATFPKDCDISNSVLSREFGASKCLRADYSLEGGLAK